MENAGWMALIIVGIILAIVLGLWKFSGGGEDDANKIRLHYENYTPVEAQYVKNALQEGCKFDRLYSLQQAGYKPYHVVMYVKLWELRGNTATKAWFQSKMNFDYDQDIFEKQIFNQLWTWCVSKGYLVAQYCTPLNKGGASMLMYENKL